MTLSNEAKREKGQFIRKVFDYYNGKINKFNHSAMLNIEWEEGESKVAANCRLPNIVTVYPYVISEYAKEDYKKFDFKIIEAIIHELYHADQVISEDRDNYKNEEDATVKQSLLYISSHREEILEQFGLDIYDVYKDFVFERAIANISDEHPYVTRKYTDHLTMLLYNCNLYSYEDDLHRAIADSIIKHNIHNDVGNIKIVIGSNTATIQDKDYLMPVDQLNKFFYDNFYSIRTNIDQYDVSGDWHENDIDGWDVVFTINNIVLK